LAGANYWLTRDIFTRALGLVYLIAFVCALNQTRPLIGEHGLLPVAAFIREVPFRQTPSIFYIFPKDWALAAAAWIGIALSCLQIAGIASRGSSWLAGLVWFVIWVLYLSFVNVGQTFYGFGWELILLEAGFFAMFLGGRNSAPQPVTLWIFRWLEFRVMFGAGLIKLRGDDCWRSLTCLNYYYETQPMPNPLSWFFHWSPQWTHTGGVLFNHFAELIVPCGYFLPQPFSSIAGLITIAFQAMIMVSGNLSWLNFVTIVLALPMIVIPGRAPALAPAGTVHRSLAFAVATVVAWLSILPIVNMLSPHQTMIASYNRFHLVGTYGAFGGITRERYEIVLEGTRDEVLTPSTRWSEYEFKGKPGDPTRMPPQIGPYHLRLDWLMWFAAMSPEATDPWFFHLIQRLLENDPATLGLMGRNPFPEAPPRYIRAQYYAYTFTTPEERRTTRRWWHRRLVSTYMRPVSLDDPGFRSLLAALTQVRQTNGSAALCRTVRVSVRPSGQAFRSAASHRDSK
jgi:Lipase maturation factor